MNTATDTNTQVKPAINTIQIDRRLAANIQISMMIMINLLDVRIDKSGVSSDDAAAQIVIDAARDYVRRLSPVIDGQPVAEVTYEQAIPSIANTPDLDDPEDHIFRDVCPIPPLPEPKHT
jgi:hypothetical protein